MKDFPAPTIAASIVVKQITRSQSASVQAGRKILIGRLLGMNTVHAKNRMSALFLPKVKAREGKMTKAREEKAKKVKVAKVAKVAKAAKVRTKQKLSETKKSTELQLPILNLLSHAIASAWTHGLMCT